MSADRAIGAKHPGPVAPEPQTSAPEPQSAARVAEQLGVPATTLHSWAQHFGLGPTVETGNGRHQYGHEDVHRLEMMRYLTISGLAPGQAAKIALKTTSPGARVSWPTEAPPAGPKEPNLRLLPAVEIDPLQLALNRAVEAALSGDYARTVAALLPPGVADTEPFRFDPIRWWTALAVPALAAVREMMMANPPGVSPESVVEAAVLRAISEILAAHDAEVIAGGGPPTTHPTRYQKLVLIIAPAADQVGLTAHALGMALVVRGASARIVSGLGGGARLRDLLDLTRPVAVVIDSESQALRAELSSAGWEARTLVAPLAGAQATGFAELVRGLNQYLR